ncbi:MAG: phosphate/phosphite/phosphonate ABC transporter substrate-binding protein [Anaerosomatales bacterium]
MRVLPAPVLVTERGPHMDVRTKAVTQRLFPQRSSRWLAYALVTSFLIVLGGSLLMWGLFAAQPVETGIADNEGQQSITVLIDRTPGGPSQWTPYIAVLKQMQDQMRVPVRAKYVAGRAEVTDAMADPRIDAAFVSIYQYLALEDDTEWELLATPIVAGRPLETAVIAVRADSPYRSFEDLEGTDIALAPGASIRGFAYARWLAVRSGSTLDGYFGAVHTGGENVENLERLAGGDVDAACVGRSHLLSWPSGTFRVVSESPEMGLPPILMRTRLPEYFRDNLRAGLRGLGPGAGLPADGPVEGFYFPTAGDYDFARTLFEYVDISVLEQQWGGVDE